MKREILFRGKDKKTLKWVVGYYAKWRDEVIYERKTRNEYKVIPETVGEYTNKDDMHGKKIFEKDIVQFFLLPIGISKDRIKIVGEVVMKKGCFGVEADGIEFMPLFNLDEENELEVIGNTIDNPELL